MTRNYGLQSKRGGLGGMSTAAPAYREGNPREYINRYFPPGSILAEPEPPLERGKFSQALIDISAAIVVVALLFLIFGSVAAIIFGLFVIHP